MSSLNQPKFLIFDADGVLWDSEILLAEVWSTVLKKIGIDWSIEKCLKNFTGISGKDKKTMLQSHYPGLVFPDNFETEKTIAKNEKRNRLKAIQGVENFLCASKIPRCIATGAKLNSLKLHLNITKLESYFDESRLYSAEMVACGKPAPDLFLYASKKNNVSPKDCLVIEDSVPGVKAAIAANMQVIGFTGSTHARENEAQYTKNLKAAGANIIARDMDTLKQLLS